MNIFVAVIVAASITSVDNALTTQDSDPNIFLMELEGQPNENPQRIKSTSTHSRSKSTNSKSKTTSTIDQSTIDMTTQSPTVVVITNKEWRKKVPDKKLSSHLTDTETPQVSKDPIIREFNEKQEKMTIQAIEAIPWLGVAAEWEGSALSTETCNVALLDTGNNENSEVAVGKSDIVVTIPGCVDKVEKKAVIRFPGDKPYFVDKIAYVYGKETRSAQQGPVFVLLKMDRPRVVRDRSKLLHVPVMKEDGKIINPRLAWWSRLLDANGGHIPPVQIQDANVRNVYIQGRTTAASFEAVLAGKKAPFQGPLGSVFYWYPDKDARNGAALGGILTDEKSIFANVIGFCDDIRTGISELSK